MALEKEKQYNRALAMYRRVLREQPGNPRAWANIGRVLLILNRYGDAQKAFRKVKELEKNDAAAQFNIGLICLEQKLAEDAIKELRPLLTNPRYQDRARYYIAMALEEKGDLKAASREYQLVDRASEQFIPARLRLAYLHYQMREKDQARIVLEDLQKLAPNREEVYLTESYFFEEENLWDRAIKALQAGLPKVDRPGEIYFRLAMLYEKINNREGSIESIKKVLELDPDNPDAQNFLGYSYAEAGINLDEAENLIRAALRAKPEAAISSTAWAGSFIKRGSTTRPCRSWSGPTRSCPRTARWPNTWLTPICSRSATGKPCASTAKPRAWKTPTSTNCAKKSRSWNSCKQGREFESRRAIRLVILLFLLLAGCRALPPAPPPAAVTSPEELLSRLAARTAVRSFQAKGRITFLSPQQNYSGTAPAPRHPARHPPGGRAGPVRPHHSELSHQRRRGAGAFPPGGETLLRPGHPREPGGLHPAGG